MQIAVAELVAATIIDSQVLRLELLQGLLLELESLHVQVQLLQEQLLALQEQAL